VKAVIAWAERNTVSVRRLSDPRLIRKVLTRISQRKDGTLVVPTSAIKARHVLSHTLDYAVECGYLHANPLSRVKWRTPRSTREVDLTSVPNPKQVRGFIDAIAEQTTRASLWAAGATAVVAYAALPPLWGLDLAPDRGCRHDWTANGCDLVGSKNSNASLRQCSWTRHRLLMALISL
jgi:hypothetical protein